MKFYDLVERISEVNRETLNQYGINLHEQRPVIRSLETLDENHDSGKNTEVVLFVNTHQVRGSQSYFYDRIDIEDTIWPVGHKPTIDLSDVDEKGLLQALLDLNDPLIDDELLNQLIENNETNLTLHYSNINTVDENALVSINCVGYMGQADISVRVDVDGPVHLDDLLVGGVLDGFDQTVE